MLLCFDRLIIFQVKFSNNKLKNITIILLLLSFFYTKKLFSNDSRINSDSIQKYFDSKELFDIYSSTTDRDFLYSNVKLKLKTDSIVSGLFLGILQSELHLLIDKSVCRIAIQDINKINIYYRNLCYDSYVNGLFSGGYLGLIFYQQSNYSDADNWTLLNNQNNTTISVGIGAVIISSLFYAVSDPETVLRIDLSNSKLEHSDILIELNKFFSGEIISKRLHFKFQLGNIGSHLEKLRSNRLKLYDIDNFNYSESNLTTFSMLRSVSLSYSYNYDFDIGIEYFYLHEVEKAFSNDVLYGKIGLKNSAYLLNWTFHPFKREISSSIDLGLSIGIGLASVGYQFKDVYYNEQHKQVQIDSKTETLFCSLANLELAYRLTDNFSLGVNTEYLYHFGGIYPNDILMKSQGTAMKKIDFSDLFFGFYLKYSFFNFF